MTGVVCNVEPSLNASHDAGKSLVNCGFGIGIRFAAGPLAPHVVDPTGF